MDVFGTQEEKSTLKRDKKKTIAPFCSRVKVGRERDTELVPAGRECGGEGGGGEGGVGG